MARERFEFEAVDMGKVHKDAPVKKFVEKKCTCNLEEAKSKAEIHKKPKNVKAVVEEFVEEVKTEEPKPKSKRPEKGSEEAKAWAQKMRDARNAKKASKMAEPKPEES